MKAGQSSIEYLLTYGLALAILFGAIALLTQTTPTPRTPETCNVNTDILTCIESIKDPSRTSVVLRNDLTVSVDVGNMTLFYRQQNTTNCNVTEPINTGTPTSSATVPNKALFDITCAAPTGIQFLPTDREQVRIEFDYREENRVFTKPAEVELII